MSEPKAFDPARHLTLVSGKEYLEVKWRLVWFRSDYPAGRIETAMVDHGPDWAIFKAVVTAVRDGEIHGLAEAHGSEDRQGFGDYLEKAETKAIGRALATLGYGTQFSYDHDMGNRVVDTPVQFRGDDNGNYRAVQSSGNQSGGGYDTGATDRQKNLIKSLARDLKLTPAQLTAMCEEVTGHPTDALTRRSASTFIEHLKERQTAQLGGGG